MKLRALAAALPMIALACSDPRPSAQPVDDGTIFSFAPVGPRAFLTEPTAGAFDGNIRGLLEAGGADAATKAYANRWVQPPGWEATVEAFGEPLEGDLYAKRGYPYRTNLIDPRSGVVVLAYTKERPAGELWATQRDVRVSGRLEGYALRPPGVVILLDAHMGATNEAPDAPESLARAEPQAR